jgi:LysR family transcriptional regulator, regulator for bpeEF and oprC
MDRLEALQLFVRVVESGSFSKAARAQNIVQPTVSKAIAALEERLGAQLLHRTSRGLSLTTAGQDYYDATVRLLGELEEAEGRIGRGQVAPAGLVRVASSAALGRMYLVPRLPAFFERFPDVAVQFEISERHVNLIEDGIDVALRIGILADSGLVARRIGSARGVTVASPAYLERRGTPETPAELANHDCVAFVFHGSPRPWTFKGPAGPIVVAPKGKIRSNDAEHIRAGVRAGLGIGHNVSWLYARELASGELRRLLTGYEPDPLPIHAVCPEGRHIPNRVRVFIDFLAETCAADPDLRIQ